MSELEDVRSPKVEELTDGERSLLGKLFGNWLAIPDSFKSALADYVSQNSLIPVSQVRGFAQTVAQQIVKTYSVASTTTSTSYTDLSSAPELTELGKGQYLLIYGFTGHGAANDLGVMSLSINGAAPSDDDACYSFGGPGVNTGPSSYMRAAYKTLTQNENTVRLKYKSNSGGTVSVNFAYLIAVRIGNA